MRCQLDWQSRSVPESEQRNRCIQGGRPRIIIRGSLACWAKATPLPFPSLLISLTRKAGTCVSLFHKFYIVKLFSHNFSVFLTSRLFFSPSFQAFFVYKTYHNAEIAIFPSRRHCILQRLCLTGETRSPSRFVFLLLVTYTATDLRFYE